MFFNYYVLSLFHFSFSLVFSQSLYTLDLIEHFLDLVDENARKNEEDQNPVLSEFRSNWDKGLDYFRLDGGTTSDNRANWCKIFNSPKNTRYHFHHLLMG